MPRRHPTHRDLRWFAALQLPFWGLIVWWNFAFFGKTAAVLVLVLAGLVGIVGVIRPAAIAGFYRGWMAVAFVIQSVVSVLVLGLLFFGMILPIGLILRCCRADPLQRRWPAPVSTGWHRHPEPGPPESYLNQY